MLYFFSAERYYKRCMNYLKQNSIKYASYKAGDNYIISVFDSMLKAKIEKAEDAFLKSEDILLDNGYLVSRKYRDKTVIRLQETQIGGKKPVFISGPCAVESEAILRETAIGIKKAGAGILRAGAYKPRTSPYDFQGLGREGIDILYKVGRELDLLITTEIMDIRELDYMFDKVDIFQVGARNMYNYPLLKELGKIAKPVLLKRGLSATVREFLLSAEYIMLEGNEKVVLCERGIRTYEDLTRNTMDISSIPLLKELTHLPVLADPTHAVGRRSLIKPLSLAALAAGADGIMIETHINPDFAWSDGNQSITPAEFEDIVNNT